jgi:hypothetical protein
MNSDLFYIFFMLKSVPIIQSIIQLISLSNQSLIKFTIVETKVLAEELEF